MKQIANINELLDYLKKSRIVIYGTGHVGKKFFWALRKNGLLQNTACFAVSEVSGNLSTVEGIPVRSIEDLSSEDSILVCVAVHEALKDEMIHTLQRLGMSEYVWIHPFLYDLLLGEPIKRDVEIEVSQILKTCREDYRLAVRWMAIDQYFGKNILGYDLYVKAESLHCEERTAQERLKRFLELIRFWEKTGYLTDSRIRINLRYEIIDGRHRVAVAHYFGQKTIRCDVYSDQTTVTKLHGEEVMLTEKVLRDHGFSVREMAALKEINRLTGDR